MENYERINAAAWDDQAVPGQPSKGSGHSEDSWTLVVNKPKKQRQNKSQPSHAPRKASPPNRQNSQTPRNFKGATSGARHGIARNERPNVSQRKPRLYQKDDSTAEEQWRTRKPAGGHVEIPAELAKHYEEVLKPLARNANAFIHSDGTDSRFEIWGDPIAVRQVRSKVTKWIRDESPKFYKIQSQTPEQRQRKEKEWRADVRRERFRRDPPASMGHDSIGFLSWPSGDSRPDGSLGKNYEALDPIRMKYRCYIVWDDGTRRFKVMGSPKHVEAALIRLRHTYFQIAARQITGVRFHFLRWPNGCPVAQVHLKEYIGPVIAAEKDQQKATAPSAVPFGSGELPTAKEVETARAKARLQLIRSKHTLGKALQSVHYFRGGLQLRLRLGRLRVDKWQGSSREFTLDKYEAMASRSQFMASVTTEIGDAQLERQALERLRLAEDFLYPQEHTHERLTQVVPEYSASFVFADAAGDICLLKRWKQRADTHDDQPSWDPIEDHWTRNVFGISGSKRLVDITLTDLSTSFSWAIEMLGDRPAVEKQVPAWLVQFAKRIKIHPKIGCNDDIRVTWDSQQPPAALKSTRYEMAYNFGVDKTDYTLECTKFQDTVYEPQSNVGGSTAKVYEARWSLQLSRAAWKNMFSENERLEVGKGAKWSDDTKSWFPPDMCSENAKDHEGVYNEEQDGYMQLMTKLDQIQSLIGVGSS